MAAQVYFPQGGAGPYEASCDPRLAVPVGDGVMVEPEPVVPLDFTLVCFTDLSPDAPIDVVITPPGGAPAAVPVTTAFSAVPAIDFTRRPSDPLGDYNVRATQGGEVREGVVSVEEADSPLFDLIATDDSSAMIGVVGMPPSQRVDLHVYRSTHSSSTYDWAFSTSIQTDQRGHGEARLDMRAAGPGTYGVITVPRAFTPTLEELFIDWPP